MLTLNEAIQVLTHPSPWVKHTATPTYLDAAQLGAEALNAIQDIRARFPTLMPDPLPGEALIPDLSPSADRKEMLRESNLGRESGQ
ncbi:unnamed protein product [marine sediment metagenome]|uniref:Uncharacterized protein n=1 Tax=marine sediment metagenome TaxID=412755 RepID=X1Q3K5_9ZZZZ